MNPSAVKLFLTLLWLVAGVGFLVHDLVSDHSFALPFGQWRLPLWVPCLLLAAFNFLRWRSNRTTMSRSPEWLGRRRQARPTSVEPDPTFNFDEPPAEAGGPER